VHGWRTAAWLYQREPFEARGTDVRGERSRTSHGPPGLAQGLQAPKGRWSDVKASPNASFTTSGIGRDQYGGLAHDHHSAERRAGRAMSLGALCTLLLAIASGLAVANSAAATWRACGPRTSRPCPSPWPPWSSKSCSGRTGCAWRGPADDRLGAAGGVVAAGLIVAWANRRLPGMALIGLGLLANLLVVGVNAAMPVPKATLERAGIPAAGPDPHELGPRYVLERPGTRLGVLGARLAVPRPEPWPASATSPRTPALSSCWSGA
jgi:Family of unknown function (DUF5317)